MNLVRFGGVALVGSVVGGMAMVVAPPTDGEQLLAIAAVSGLAAVMYLGDIFLDWTA